MEREKLEKSIDSLIDQLFMKKSEEFPGLEHKHEAGNPNTPELAEKVKDADQQNPEKPEEEEEGKNGRPKDPSNMDQREPSGQSHLNYPESVSSPASEPAHETTVAKSEKIEISKEDFEFLKKAKDAEKKEVLKKAREEQANLIKAVIMDATKELRTENTELKKSVNELQETVKKALRQPKPQKSISSVQALEKSFGGNAPEQKSDTFSKAEMLDAAERLVKANKLPVEAAIELEDSGYIYNPALRAVLEQELKRNR